ALRLRWIIWVKSMKSRSFKQSVCSRLIKPFKSSADRLHCGHFEQSSWSCAAVKQHFTHRSSGFTLLEVMVALAIFATAAMTLTKVAMQYTQSTSNAILRTKAQFVALNEVAQMEINQQWMDGTASKQLTQQVETWQIDKRIDPTISVNVQRIALDVSLINQESCQVASWINCLMFFTHRMNNTP